MKIAILDEDTRLVTFDDGTTVRVLRGWKRLGGAGWVGGEQTFRSIREAARRQRRADEKKREREHA